MNFHRFVCHVSGKTFVVLRPCQVQGFDVNKFWYKNSFETIKFLMDLGEYTKFNITNLLQTKVSFLREIITTQI